MAFIIIPTVSGSVITFPETSNANYLTVTLHSNTATVPTKGSNCAAGYDLYAAEDWVIPTMENGLITTDISVKLPHGTYGRIAARSGLALHHNLMVGGGVIDADYTGIVKVILFNLGPFDYCVQKGERIAQLICEKISYPEILVNKTPFNSSVDIGRGSHGFGSSGK